MKRATALERTEGEPESGASRIRGHRIGHLAGWLPGAGPVVDYPGNPHGPIVARSVIPVTPDWSNRTDRLELLLTFDAERADRPIVIGVLQPVPDLEAEAAPAPGPELAALVDGKRVVIKAEDEIVLECGEASITLRRNGRVVIRGTYVESRAVGVNRIRGGNVAIN